MTISPEEFFMYLTIGLIVLIPLLARLYRYFTMKQVARTLREQFGQEAPRDWKNHQDKR